MNYLEQIQTDIFTLVDEAYSTIPSNFDFINNTYAIEIRIGDSIIDNDFRDEVSMQIRITGIENNKINIQQKALDLHAQIDNISNELYWIVGDNPYYTSYMDEDKFNAILMYKIYKY